MAHSREGGQFLAQFGSLLKGWRSTRGLSQLQLAGLADVSARHISFLETGRARPSRDMVLHLSEVLDVPRPERNRLLYGAGFAALYRQEAPDSALLKPINDAITHLLSRHDPYPAIVLDGLWRLRHLNTAARALLKVAGLSEGDSLLKAICDPDWGPSIIENWGEVGHHTMVRLRSESLQAGGVSELDEAVARLAADPAIAAWRPTGPLPPVIPTIYRAGGLRLGLFSTFSQFRTAEDIVVADLNIELMFPADEETRGTLNALASVS